MSARPMEPYVQPPPELAFPWIVAWGEMLRSPRTLIERQVRKARESGAPWDAIYWDMLEDVWRTLSFVQNAESRQWLIEYAGTHGLRIPTVDLIVWATHGPVDDTAVEESTRIEPLLP